MATLQLDHVSRLWFVQGDATALLAAMPDTALRPVAVQKIALWPPRPTTAITLECPPSPLVSVVTHTHASRTYAVGFLPPSSSVNYLLFKALAPTPDFSDVVAAPSMEEYVYVPVWSEWMATAQVDEIDVFPAIHDFLLLMHLADMVSLMEATHEGTASVARAKRMDYAVAQNRPTIVLAFHLVLFAFAPYPELLEWFERSYLSLVLCLLADVSVPEPFHHTIRHALSAAITATLDTKRPDMSCVSDDLWPRIIKISNLYIPHEK